MSDDAQLTPMMAQYRRIKAGLPKDALLLFRLGDFYEMFFEDAKDGAQLLNVALTARQGTPMCGIPYHAANAYVGRLLKAGRKVAICDQTEEAKPGKLVNREVSAILSPGAHLDERLLTPDRNNFLTAVAFVGSRYGIAAVDLSTGDFRVTEAADARELRAELDRLRPAEIVFPGESAALRDTLAGLGAALSGHEDWTFQPETAYCTVRDHFQVASLDGYGLKGMQAGISAAGGALHYLGQHLRRDLTHVNRVRVYIVSDFLILDSVTLRTLEILEPQRPDAGRQTTLFGAVNRAVTPMGARRLRDWLAQPLARVAPIRRRQEAVRALASTPAALEAVRKRLGSVRDLERTLGRLSLGSGNARDLVALRDGLRELPALRRALNPSVVGDTADRLAFQPASAAVGDEEASVPAGVFGPIWPTGESGLNSMLRSRKGEAPAVALHQDHGRIDCIFGDNDGESASFGLAAIEARHPGFTAQIGPALGSARELSRSGDDAVWEAAGVQVNVRRRAGGGWLVTGPASSDVSWPLLAEWGADLWEAPELCDLLTRALLDEPPLALKEGGIIKDGFSPELDELRAASRGGKDWIARLQREEAERTGIASLKVGFNAVFGYYIEVTKANLAKVPADYIRKQTVANGERFITPGLKEMESKILGADERSARLEYDLFLRLREEVLGRLKELQAVAAALSSIDAAAAFAETARLSDWVKPVVGDEGVMSIKDGRHPVLENASGEERFVPNDAELDPAKAQIAVITGPNMAGKSTYIRQVALIALLAHAGSFVPAASARVDLIDRIFTRIGASDDLSRGQSTFMVEMSETANILNNATRRSLVILDEVGRGTSTFDGLSLAWSIVEHLHHQVGAKTLFATHYHELTDLAVRLPRVTNWHVAVREWNDQIVFLRKVRPGGSDKSYGIQVARLAGVPRPVVDRAKVILRALEEIEMNLQQVADAGEGGASPEAGPEAPKAPRRKAERRKLQELAPPPQMDLFTEYARNEPSAGAT
jgi:DNA mismatch repair ATPase MutS